MSGHWSWSSTQSPDAQRTWPLPHDELPGISGQKEEPLAQMPSGHRYGIWGGQTWLPPKEDVQEAALDAQEPSLQRTCEPVQPFAFGHPD